jgi:imidazolonepropionase-like amidohydrolase
MHPRLLALTFLLSSFACAQESAAPGTLIVHVTVIDVATGHELPNQTVTIHDKRITSVGLSNDTDPVPPGAIDAHGAYLIPGLWDMHVHIHSVDELPLYVANGVTGVRIMSGERDERAFRAELNGKTPSPEIYLASAIVDGSPPVWPNSIVIHNASDAVKAVDEIKAGGADFVKVYERIPKAAYLALAEEAKKQNLPFEGHVPDEITAQEASDAGQRSFEHLIGIGLACSNAQQTQTADLFRARFFRDRMVVLAQAYRSYDPKRCQALFQQFRRNDTWQVPTLTVLRLWSKLDDSKFLDDKRMDYIGKRTRERWQQRIGFQERNWSMPQFRLAGEVFNADKMLVGTMFRAGVSIMAGTDAGNPYCFAGFSLHDELGLLVESGMTPLAALQAATINPARFMGRTDIETIATDKQADLVLLSADPLADIHNTTQVQAVWMKGKYFDRAALDGLLAQAKKDAKKD